MANKRVVARACEVSPAQTLLLPQPACKVSHPNFEARLFPWIGGSYCLDSFAAHVGIRKSKGTLRCNAWTIPCDLGKGCESKRRLPAWKGCLNQI